MEDYDSQLHSFRPRSQSQPAAPSPSNSLLISFHHEEGRPFDVDMPPAGPAASEGSQRITPLLPPLDTNLRNFNESPSYPSGFASNVPSPSIPSVSTSQTSTTSADEGQKSAPSPLPVTPSSLELCELYDNSQISSRTSQVQTWELQCYKCHSWINTAISTTRFLDQSGQFQTLEQHMRGKKCKPKSGFPAPLSRAPSFSVRSTGSQGSPSQFSRSPSLASLPPFSPAPSSTNSLSWSPLLASPALPFVNESPDSFRLSHHRILCAPQTPAAVHSSMEVDEPEFESAGLCSGLRLEWPPELPFRSTFPFHRLSFLGDDPDECALRLEIEIRERGKVIDVWSKECRRITTPHSPHCQACEGIRGRLEDLAKIARDAKPGTNLKYLGHDQLREQLVERNEEMNKLKLQTLNLGRRLASFARKLDDFDRLLVAIAENDIPRIHAIIETARRNGASVRTMVNFLTEAVDGLRHTKGFTAFEKDLGILIYRLGGRSLLYAMNHSLNLPSLRTICNSAKFVKVTPTIGPISEYEIRRNIQNVMLVPRSEAEVPYTGRRGVTIMMDECAIEEQACYFSHANQVGGLCQKHSRGIPLDLKTHDSATRLVSCLHDGTLHFGKEMAFVAARCSGETTIYPLVCAPTCKQETWEDMADLFRMILKVWKETGQAAIGEIWNFATDGDQLRRRAGHAVFMQFELGPEDTLHFTLSNLLGLNLFTGPCRILITFDWRHIIKRHCTLLRHVLGIALDNGRVVGPVSLTRCLLLLPDQDAASVNLLLNPDDPQDVPTAIELLETIVQLRQSRAEFDVPASEVNLNSDLDAIDLLSFMLEALLNAFTLPSASLSDQIYSLSLYANMSFVLFRTFRLKFMSNQLYGDSQTMIKNIVFTVAKQQELDPEGKVNAYHDGTDPVEQHFGYTRELGGHNSAMNFKQGVERTGWACDIQGVHERNPGLHPGHRRRNVTRKEIKDHLNEYNFSGDYVVGHCDLGASWWRGRVEAMRIFRTHSHLDSSVFDIAAILASTPGLDFLRPHGGGLYPGISDEPDRSLPPATTSTTSDSSPDAPSSIVSTIQSSTLVYQDPDRFDDLIPDLQTPALPFVEDIQNEDSEPVVLKLDPRPGVRPEDYLLDENNKFVHKASICRLILNKEFIAKSKNRTERAMGMAIKKVRTFTKPNATRLGGGITGSSFIVGDPFTTLIRTSTNVSLALVRCTEILVDGKRATDVNAASIKNPKANVKMSGQILKLKAVVRTQDDVFSDSSEEIPIESTWSWLWLGSYLMTKSTIKGTQIATDTPHIISVAGHLVEPVNPKAVTAHDRLATEDMQHINSTGTTWAMEHNLLGALTEELWKRVEAAQTGLREMPNIKDELAGFPYSWATGIPALLSDGGTAFITAKSAEDPCLYCSEVPSNWRGHMGAHILRKLRNAGEVEREKRGKKTGEVKTYPEVGESYPCGFCGRSGRPECAVSMKPKGQSFEIITKCKYEVKFQYQTANKGSATTPSRNLPIICGLCPVPQSRYPTYPAVWRYNMPQHLLDQHSEYASPLQPEGMLLPFKVWENVRIEKAEELALGIPESSVPQPFSKVAQVLEEDASRVPKRGQSGGQRGAGKRGRRGGPRGG
ncbi:hypothetical protein R3P38DRAFT_3078646 [Favolaschia claudopus]|uniref:Uncharacterized protein n=1 Tax=Favolaschia claudopus TaxID=2862362 RepID=A0AAV9ZWG6_9AGAR